NPVLNAVLSGKNAEAENVGVELDIYVEPGTNMKMVSDADLIAMMGNLLDNAVRAAKETDDKKVTIRIFTDNDGSFNIVKITNHYKGELKKENGKYHTTKKEKGLHGIGLKSVDKIAEKYGGYMESFVEDGIFTSVLTILKI
ncbi:MAG: sensor histidine kinase, partial [Lachnospiraceae bacterium]|nr:sensor histidine kinase [Lachnospiraceae bacterium]